MQNKSNGKRLIKPLDPSMVVEYTKKNLAKGQLEKEVKALRGDIVLMMRGRHPKHPNIRFVSPVSCMYLLKLNYQKRSQMEWELYAESLLLIVLKLFQSNGKGSIYSPEEVEERISKYADKLATQPKEMAYLHERAAEVMAKVKASAGFKRIPMLEPPRINPNYVAVAQEQAVA